MHEGVFHDVLAIVFWYCFPIGKEVATIDVQYCINPLGPLGCLLVATCPLRSHPGPPQGHTRDTRGTPSGPLKDTLGTP